MRLIAAAKTDVGRRRFHNEDAFFLDSDRGVFAVADGVGGANAGEVASSVLCETVESYADRFQHAASRDGSVESIREGLLALMDEVYQAASARIYQMAEEHTEMRGMATTGVVLVVGRRGAVLGHVGDSRAYLVRSGSVERLTVDHTLVQEMITQGLLSAEDASSFPHQNVLARAVGQLPTVRVDIAWLDIRRDDSILLCSDGLHRYFQDKEIPELLVRGVDFAVEKANDAGGEDNITAIEVTLQHKTQAQDSQVLDTQSKILGIQNLFLFKYLNYQELVRVLKIVYEAHYETGAAVFSEGEPGDVLFLVFAGSVSVAKEGTTLTSVGPGEHFGELAFIDGAPRSATVTAREPTTLLKINRDDFRNLTRTDPVVASKLLWCFVNHMSVRLRDLSRSYVKAWKR